MIDARSWRAETANGLQRDAAGELRIGGAGARALAEQFGTPLVVYDLDALDAAIAQFTKPAARGAIDVAYAAKAFFCVALARHIAATPLHVDVCSLGELISAERGGIPPERLVFHGCGKTDEELAAIAARRVAYSVVDNREELERLAAIAHGPPLPIVLRLNTGIEALTHAYVRTSGGNTKFGFPLVDLDAIVARVASYSQLRIIGLHSHIGSQIDDAATFEANLETLLAAAERMRATGTPVERLIAGGGFAVAYRPHETAIDGGAIVERFAARIAGTPYTLGIEPGRAIAARAGTSLYRVMAVKTAGSRRFVIVDGGIADNPRPALYGAYHHPLVACSDAVESSIPATVCGRSCENDVLVETDLPADLRAGDLLAMCTTGAYTFSMASTYNRFTKPCVAFARGGEARVAVARQRVDEILADDR